MMWVHIYHGSLQLIVLGKSSNTPSTLLWITRKAKKWHKHSWHSSVCTVAQPPRALWPLKPWRVLISISQRNLLSFSVSLLKTRKGTYGLLIVLVYCSALCPLSIVALYCLRNLSWIIVVLNLKNINVFLCLFSYGPATQVRWLQGIYFSFLFYIV